MDDILIERIHRWLGHCDTNESPAHISIGVAVLFKRQGNWFLVVAYS